MMQQLANFIVDHDPLMVLRRTHDTVRYIRWVWNKDHADPIDEEELRLFLCDEHYGDLTLSLIHIWSCWERLSCLITKAAAPKSGWYQNVIPTTFLSVWN